MNQPAFQHDDTWELPENVSTREGILKLFKESSSLTPGKYLKQLRELENITQAEIATDLGISPSQISALESDDYDSLPAPIFVKNYFKRYCAALGISDEDVINAYENANKTTYSPTLNRVSLREKLSSANSSSSWLAYLVGGIVLSVALFFGILSFDVDELINQTMGPQTVEDPALELSLPTFVDSEAGAEQTGLGALEENTEEKPQ